jgi:hypothetical protein
MNLEALILKQMLLEQDEETEKRPEEKKDLTPFEEDPMGFILKKYSTLNELLTELMTGSFKEYLDAIFIVAPKPTTFKILLHNGQYFFLTYLGKAYEATISGKKYYLMTTGEKQLCMQAIARLLRFGSPLKTKGPEGAEKGTEGVEDTSVEEPETETPPAEGGEELKENNIAKRIIESYILKEEKAEEDILAALKKNKNVALMQPVAAKHQGGSKYKVYLKGINPTDRKARVDLLAQLTGLSNVKVIKKGAKLSHDDYAEVRVPSGTFKVYFKGSSETATSTNVKEGLVMSFYYSSIEEPITLENFDSSVKAAISATNRNKDIDANLKEELTTYLRGIQKNKDNVKTLNQPLSQALTIKSAYPDARLVRSGIFNAYRSEAQQQLKMPADKWCPGDVYVLLNSAEAETILALAKEQDNPASFIEILNDAFNENWGSKEAPMTAVSLKFEKAQGGKAKAYFEKFRAIKDDYNLTKDEINYKEKNYIDGIQRLRKVIQSKVRGVKDIKYILPAGDKLEKNIDKLRGKYAALKALNFFFDQLDKSEYDDGLVALVAFAMSLSDTSPAFFKVVASSSGQPTKPETYPRGGSLALFMENNKIMPIEIVDEPSFGGLKIDMTVSKGGDPYRINLVARNNGGVQGTIEIASVKPQ